MALTLLNAGRRVLVAAGEIPAHSSRAALGVVNPITGMRFTPSYRFDEAIGPAREFYQSCEKSWRTRIWHPAPIHRLFTDAREARRWEQRRLELPADWSAREIEPGTQHPWSPYMKESDLGGITLSGGGWLDIPRVLDLARAEFTQRDCLITTPFDPLATRPDGDGLSWQGHRFRQGAILCEGYLGLAGNPLLEALPRRSAKGEVLLIRADLPSSPDLGIIQRGLFLAPTGEPGVWRAGATYEWAELTPHPTAQGRAWLEARLRRHFRFDWEIVDHVAGVRPILTDKLPILGRLPGRPGFAVLNGLASKGALLAPWAANLLLRHLEGDADIPPELDVRRNFPNKFT